MASRGYAMRPPRLRTVLLMVGVPVSVMGLIGGILGMLAGLYAPEVVTGLYALDGPDPPPTFSPVVWGTQKGLIWGLALGVGVGVMILLFARFVTRRPLRNRNGG
jgi:hypothetical protein